MKQWPPMKPILSCCCRYITRPHTWNVWNKHELFRTGKPLTIWFSLLARAALKVQLEFNSITKVNHVRMSCYSFGTWIINQYQVNRSFFNHFHRWNFSNEKQKRKRDRQTERERGGSGRPSFEIDVCCWCCFRCCYFCCWCVHLEPLINQTM